MKFAVRGVLLGVGLLVAQLSSVSAQEDVSGQKRVAIRKLIVGFEMPRHTSSVFEELTTLYQENWTVTVIADLKEKGLFKRYTPKQASTVEKLINEFSSDMFGEIRRRMRAEVFTPESLENMVLPTFDKYLTEGEITELVDFSQSSSSRKLLDAYYKVLTEATVLRLKKSGAFDVQASPDAEKAKFDKLKKESESDPQANINEIFSTARRLAREQYTQSEIEEWSSLTRKPLWIKLAQVSSSMAVEIQANSARLYGPRVEKLTHEVIGEQLKNLDRRINDAIRP